MSATLLTKNNAGGSLGFGVTTNFPISGGGNPTTTESREQHVFRQAGTLTNLWATVSANSINTGTTTLRVRVDGANGNNILSIAAAATGEFLDASNSDTISAGQKVCLQLVVSGASGSITTRGMSSTFTPTAHHCKLISFHGSGTATTGSITTYVPPAGNSQTTTAEINAQFMCRVAGTWKNLQINVRTNTRSDASTFKSRINTAAGAQSVSITASTTGWFEDNTNTDTVASGDLLSCELATGAGTGSMTHWTCGSEIDNSSGAFELGTSTAVGQAVAVSLTRYIPFGDTVAALNATESLVSANSEFAFTASRLRCYLSLNTHINTATLRFRINAASGTQVIAIGTLATGWFEDAANTDAVAAGDLICAQLVTGATTGSMTVHVVGATGTVSGGVSNISGSSTMALALSGTATGKTSLSGSTTFSLAFGGTLAGVGALVGATTFGLSFAGTATGLGALAGSATFSLAFSGSSGGMAQIAGSTTFSLAFSAGLIGTGRLISSTTFALGFSGALGAQIPISGSIPMALVFVGGLTTNLISGSITIGLGLTGTLDVPVEPVVDPCERYQCDGNVEELGSTMVAAGYRLSPVAATELADRATPRLANNSVRLPPVMVGSCKRVRK